MLVGAVAAAAIGVVRLSPAHRAALVGAPVVPAPLPGDRPRARARTTGLNPALLAAVIEQESKFRADARRSTGRDRPHAAPAGDGEGDRASTRAATISSSPISTIPEINVRYGAWYLRHLLDKYQRRAARARGVQRRAGERRPWRRKGEDMQFPETRAYVSRVERLKDIYRRAYASQLGLQ